MLAVSDPETLRLEIRRAKGAADRFRRYTVLVDEHDCGSVKSNGVWRDTVTPGEHDIRLRLDWCTSKTIRFLGRAGEAVVFTCQSRSPYDALYNITSRKDDYMEFRQIEP
jgi:hypothetical protein